MAGTKFGWQRDDPYSDDACDTPCAAPLTAAQRWPLLSPADIAGAGTDRALLTVRIVERYGISHEWAARHIADWDLE